MEPKFVNRYDFTFKLCREWTRHPINRKYKRKMKKIFCILLTVYIVYIFFTIAKVINKEPLDIYNDCITPVLSFIGLCFFLIICLKIKYNSWLKSQKNNNTLTYTFADNILIENSTSKAEHEYSEIVQIKDDEDYFYLYLSFDYAIRIRKDSFIIGSADEFKEFISSVKLSI